MKDQDSSFIKVYGYDIKPLAQRAVEAIEKERDEIERHKKKEQRSKARNKRAGLFWLKKPWENFSDKEIDKKIKEWFKSECQRNPFAIFDSDWLPIEIYEYQYILDECIDLSKIQDYHEVFIKVKKYNIIKRWSKDE